MTGTSTRPNGKFGPDGTVSSPPWVSVKSIGRTPPKVHFSIVDFGWFIAAASCSDRLAGDVPAIASATV